MERFYFTEHTKAIDGERTIERSKPIQKFQMDVNEIRANFKSGNTQEQISSYLN